jgi:outer membrane protein OmpA-like peptidoglycan-associated protein
MLIADPMGWECTSENATADIFQPCNEQTKVGSLNVNFQTPENNNGFQVPRTGKNYAGIFIYSDNHDDLVYREYLIGTLTHPLERGKQYTVSAYVSLSDNSEMATDDLGFYFYKDKKTYNPLYTQVLPYIPQVRNTLGRILGNKKRWIRIQGIYTAQGGEQYFVFGCFTDYTQTNLVFLEEGKKEDIITSCFYYVDDICVAEHDDCGTQPEDADSTITLPYVPVQKGKAYLQADFYDKATLKPIEVIQKHYIFGNGTVPVLTGNGSSFRQLLQKDTAYMTRVEAKNYVPRFFYTETPSYINYLGNQLYHFYRGTTPLTPIANGAKSPLLHYYYYSQNNKIQVPFYEKELDAIAEMLKLYPDIKINILSHGILVDSSKYFSQLNVEQKRLYALLHTENRAKRIAKYLYNKGISADRVTPIGRGNLDKYGEYLNEIEITFESLSKISDVEKEKLLPTEKMDKVTLEKSKPPMENSPSVLDKIKAIDKFEVIDSLDTSVAVSQSTIEKIIAKEKFIVYGKIFNAKNKLSVFAPVKVIDESGEYVMANSIQGKFSQIVVDGNYTVFVNKQGYLPYDTAITVTHDSIFVAVGLRPIEVNESFTIENILFEPSSYKLLSSSHLQLNKIVDFLLTNPTVKLGIYGHTDKGTATSTFEGLLQLSTDRANSVMQYLLEKGISKDRLTLKGFGSSRPIASNDTQEGMAKNRRTEFVILSK